MSPGGNLVSSTPSNLTLPAVGLINCRMARPVVDLPQPLSPTRPRVSPRRMNKSTPSTALTWATVRPSKPPLMGKWTFKPLTSTSVVPVVAGVVISCSITFLFPLVWIETRGDLFASTDRHQFWSLAPATLLHLGAAWRVGATDRWFQQVGWLASNGRQLATTCLVESRD